MTTISCAADVLTLTARLRDHLGITPAAGHLVEWAAAQACDGDLRENGTGHDFAMSTGNPWNVPKERDPRALLPGNKAVPDLVTYEKVIAAVEQRKGERLRELVDHWQADDRLWIEVKHHFLDKHHLDDGPSYFHDTRRGRPSDFFAPVADAYVKVFLNPDGTLRSAWLIPHADLIRYVREETGRSGAWNYKIAFSPEIPVGINMADAMQTALAAPFPDAAITA